LAAGCANEVLKGEVETGKKREMELQRQLDDAQKNLVSQDEQNEMLLRKQVEYQRDQEQNTRQLERFNTELLADNQKLSAQNEELNKYLKQKQEKLDVQNASLQKTPSVTIVPNNSVLQSEMELDDPNMLPIRYSDEKIIIEIQDELLFRPGTLELTEEGKNRLRKIAAEVLRCYPNNIYQLEGHTDRPSVYQSEEYSNQEYSIKKAGVVMDFLLRETGVRRDQVLLGGCGSIRPIVSNETEINRRRNRRVQWIITPEHRPPGQEYLEI